jgi:hypothetical protein
MTSPTGDNPWAPKTSSNVVGYQTPGQKSIAWAGLNEHKYQTSAQLTGSKTATYKTPYQTVQDSNPNKVIDTLSAKKRAIQSDIDYAKQRIFVLEGQKSITAPGPAKTALQTQINDWQSKLRIYSAQLIDVNQQIAHYGQQSDRVENNRFKTLSKQKKKKPGPADKPKPPPPADTTLQYNVGSVSEAYFTSRSEFLLDGKNTETLHSAVAGDKPTPALSSALELWNNGKASKGMFITWGDLNTGFQAENADQGLEKLMHEALPPHAFRFQYNPGSISMAYAGTPLVDPNFEASGQDKFNLVGTGVTQSTIQFQLLINRMYDMKYYWREDEIITGGALNGPDGEKIIVKGNGAKAGTLKPDAQNVYGAETVDETTQQAIYNLGTMYDFEFLLRTIMGYSMKSSLRDYSFFKDGGTADMGFLGARPVELHLGKNLRYLVFITGINVEHVIFDNRMVPLFSNVSITCSRLPDYQSSGATTQTPGTTSYPLDKQENAMTARRANH